MRRKQRAVNADIQQLLEHIHSLGGIADREQIGNSMTDMLIRQGLLRQIWIGAYALTEAGEEWRRKGHDNRA